MIDPNTGQIEVNAPTETVSAQYPPADPYVLPADGDTDHPGLVPGLYTVDLTAPGYEPAAVTVQVAQGTVTIAPQVSMAPLGMLAGRITTQVGFPTGTTCVVVTAAGAPAPPDGATCTADVAAGTCAVGTDAAIRCGLVKPDGTYQVRGLTHGGYTAYVLLSDPEYVAPEPFNLQIELASDANYDPVLNRLGRISVTVEQPNPETAELTLVAGATVVAKIGNNTAATAISGPDGIALLTGLDNLRYSVTATGDAGTATIDQSAQLNQTADVVLVLTRSIGTVIGQIVTNAGEINPVGVDGAQVTVTGVVGYNGLTPVFASATLITDINGCFAVVPDPSVTPPTGPTAGCPAGGITDAAAIRPMNIAGKSLVALPVTVSVSETLKTESALGAKLQIVNDNSPVKTLPVITVSAKPSPTDNLKLTSNPVNPSPPRLPAALPVGAITVLSKPPGAGQVTVTETSVGPDGTGTLQWVDPTFSSNLAAPGRYTLQASLLGWGTATADVICPLGEPCAFASPFTLVRNPTFRGTVQLLPTPQVGVSPADGTYSVVSGPTPLPGTTLTADAAGNLIWQEQGAPTGLIRPGTYQISGTLGGFESQPLDFTCGDGPGDCTPPPLILSRFAQTTLEFSSDVIGPGSVPPNGAAVRLTGGNGEQNLLAPANSSQIELGALSTFNTGYTVQVRAAGFQTRTVQLSALTCTDAAGVNPTNGLHPGVNRCAMTLTQLGRIPLRTWAASSTSPTSAVLSSVAVSAQQVASADPAAPPIGDPFSISTASDGTGLITGSNSREGLLSGFYRITASLPGYETTTGTVQILGATLLPGTFPVDGNGALTISLQVTPLTLPVQLISGGVAILPVGSVTVLGNDVTRTCTLTAVDAANCDPADSGTTVFGGTPKSINFAGLIPAVYTVAFTPTDDRYRPVSQQVQLFAGTPPPPVKLDLALRASGQSGTVLNSSGQPLAGAVVSLRQFANVEIFATDINNQPVPDVTTSTTGEFAFNLVKDGTYTAMVDAPGWNRVFSSAIPLNSQNAPVPVTVRVTTRITRTVTMTLTTTADPTVLAGAQVTFQPVPNTQPAGTIPPNAALSGFTVSTTSPYTVTAPQVPTGSWTLLVTPAGSGSAFGPFETTAFDVPDPPRPTPAIPPGGETNPPSATVEVSRELQLGIATLTVTWPEGCAAQPATGTLPIELTRSGVTARVSATVTPGANGAGSAVVSVLLPTGSYTWAPTLTGGWTVNPVPAGTNTFNVPADGTPPVTVSRTATLLAPQVPVQAALTIDGNLQSSPTIAALRPGTGASVPATGTAAGIVSFCLEPTPGWTFRVRNTATTPQLLVPDQTATVVRGTNRVDFAGFTFTPTVALTAITGRIPGSPSQAVALSMPLGDGNTWTSNVTIAANSTSVAALPVILGGGTKTLTATPAGTIFGVQTLAVNPATTPTPTITLPYAAVTLTVKATIAGTATAGAVVTLTPAGGTTPQTTAVPAGGGDPVAIFRDIPPGPYSMTATVTATGATGTLPTAALDVGAQARSVVMAVP